MPLIVNTLADHELVIPVGNPVTVAFVAPVVVYVVETIAVPIHTVWEFVPAPELNVNALVGWIVIVPVFVIVPQPPVREIVYVKLPDVGVGVPLMVNTFAAHVPVTPPGNPVTLAAVAPVVL